MSAIDNAIDAVSKVDGSVLDKALAMTKSFVDAAAPVVKQAYELGLLTLRVDALGILVPAVVFLILGLVFSLKVGPSMWKRSETKRSGDEFPLQIGAVIGWVLSACAIVGALIPILNVWIWVKLFSPELWLVHQAIEKVMK